MSRRGKIICLVLCLVVLIMTVPDSWLIPVTRAIHLLLGIILGVIGLALAIIAIVQYTAHPPKRKSNHR